MFCLSSCLEKIDFLTPKLTGNINELHTPYFSNNYKEYIDIMGDRSLSGTEKSDKAS